MTFGDYVRLIRTYWRSVVATIVIGIGAAVGLSFAMTAQYTASAQVLFTAVSNTASGQDLAYTGQYTQDRMVVYQGLVTTPEVLGEVVDSLGLDETATKLADHVSAAFTPTSTLLTIKVEDPDAARATRIARAVSRSLIDAVAQVEVQQDPTVKTDDKGVSRVAGQLVSEPTEPTSPTSPDFQRNIAAGALLGLILGLGQAAIRFLRAGLGAGLGAGGTRPERRRWRLPFASKPKSPAPVVAPVAASLQPPKAPSPAKPKPQKRPGKRTRRR